MIGVYIHKTICIETYDGLQIETKDSEPFSYFTNCLLSEIAVIYYACYFKMIGDDFIHSLMETDGLAGF